MGSNEFNNKRENHKKWSLQHALYRLVMWQKLNNAKFISYTNDVGPGKALYERDSLYVVYFKYVQYVKENRGNINITRKIESQQWNCGTQNLKWKCHLTFPEQHRKQVTI